jgi:hypothetical protein
MGLLLTRKWRLERLMINIGLLLYITRKKISHTIFKRKYNEWTCVHKYGKEADKTFYCIRREGDAAGLFSYILYVLEKIEIADKNNYYPVIDMQNQINSYLYPWEVGRINSWEYYFEQPSGIGLKELRKCRNVIYSDTKCRCKVGSLIFYDSNAMEKWTCLFEKYIHLNKHVKQYIDNAYAKKMGKGGERILGVLARGTDYNAGPALHPVQPDVETIIKDAKRLMKEKNLSKLFLATEDEDIFTRFKCEFQNQLIAVDTPRYKGTERITQRKNDRKKDKYLQGLDYLTTIYLLAKCQCLLAGNTNGSLGAGLINAQKYEYIYIYSLGNYPERK